MRVNFGQFRNAPFQQKGGGKFSLQIQCNRTFVGCGGISYWMKDLEEQNAAISQARVSKIAISVNSNH
jgi:hypothetical protein